MNFVEVIGNYDKQRSRSRFIVFTLLVCSIAAIFLTTVIVERFSTPRFPSINALVPSTATSEIQVFASPTEQSAELGASPTAALAEVTAMPTESSAGIDMQATQRQAMLEAMGSRR